MTARMIYRQLAPAIAGELESGISPAELSGALTGKTIGEIAPIFPLETDR